ncbi:serine acetyltransferase 4-like isoform X2 [Hibiscus syriacus]|uniref:serine acetyltransferase 4-like isoform X2 n=1 Tax=Hibiscus syriacus TaxID=106335 RepID=UPI0019220D42|nr:serine acetyltransferase 4-like isoform X2 [Hibiscus syriacus]
MCFITLLEKNCQHLWYGRPCCSITLYDAFFQGVTLGGTGKETDDRHPKVGDLALLGACVTVLGNIKIGEGAMVAAGSIVLKHVPPHSMVAGTPAQVIGSIDEQDPSLTMNHDATKEFFKHALLVREMEDRNSKAIG